MSGWDGLTDEVNAASESVEDGETGFEEPALSPFSGLLEPGDEPGESGEEEEEDEEEEGATPAWILSELARGGCSRILFGPSELKVTSMLLRLGKYYLAQFFIFT